MKKYLVQVLKKWGAAQTATLTASISLTALNALQWRNFDVFESSNISETKEATPAKIGVHACDIISYLHEFFESILSD